MHIGHGFAECNWQKKSHHVKNEARPYSKHTGQLSWQVLCDERIKSSVENGDVGTREVKGRYTQHVWQPLWTTWSLSFTTDWASSQSPGDEQEPVLSLWRAYKWSKDRHVLTRNNNTDWSGNSASPAGQAGGILWAAGMWGLLRTGHNCCVQGEDDQSFARHTWNAEPQEIFLFPYTCSSAQIYWWVRNMNCQNGSDSRSCSSGMLQTVFGAVSFTEHFRNTMAIMRVKSWSAILTNSQLCWDLFCLI